MRNPTLKKQTFGCKTEMHRPYGMVPVFPVDQFMYHKADQSFSQEASSLEIEIGNVYEVIVLHNPKTGGRRVYHLTKVLRDSSGEDIGGWEYVCLSQPNLKVSIWND